jgi:hypothetical protein
MDDQPRQITGTDGYLWLVIRRGNVLSDEPHDAPKVA